VYEGKTVAVVVPAYNEEKLIGTVLDTMPEFVDLIIVVDDASTDRTPEIVTTYHRRLADRLVPLRHTHNQGVGAAIVTGYKQALLRQSEVIAVMAGDGQMDPDDLVRLVAPVAGGAVEYAKGNRLFRGESWRMMPHSRYLGNAVLSLLTKIASGYWHIADSQSGYTAIARVALERLDLDRVYKRYGMPNDLLIKLNVDNFRVRDVSVRPIYNIGEVSGIRLQKVVPTISWLLLAAQREVHHPRFSSPGLFLCYGADAVTFRTAPGVLFPGLSSGGRTGCDYQRALCDISDHLRAPLTVLCHVV
jgi:glycosyltransferase involved in cell wall biosynthesis